MASPAKAYLQHRMTHRNKQKRNVRMKRRNSLESVLIPDPDLSRTIRDSRPLPVFDNRESKIEDRDYFTHTALSPGDLQAHHPRHSSAPHTAIHSPLGGASPPKPGSYVEGSLSPVVGTPERVASPELMQITNEKHPQGFQPPAFLQHNYAPQDLDDIASPLFVDKPKPTNLLNRLDDPNYQDFSQQQPTIDASTFNTSERLMINDTISPYKSKGGDEMQSLIPKKDGDPYFSPEDDSEKSTTLQTAFNVVNMYVGLGLLSKGYAVAQGGWVSLGVLFFCLIVFLHTGKLIVQCFQCIPEHKGVEPTYPNLGFAAMGKTGKWTVMIMILLEFFGANCMCMIVYWQNLIYLLPSGIDHWLTIVVASAVSFPCVCIKNYSGLSVISMVGFISSVLTTLLVVCWFLRDPSQVHNHKIDNIVDVENLPISTGIFLISLSGHAILPSLRSNMKKPQQYNTMLDLSFFIMFVVYVCMGVFAYLLFGQANDVLVTSNLTQAANNLPERIVNRAIAGLVAFSSFSTIGPGTAVLGETISDMVNEFVDFNLQDGFMLRVNRVVILALTCVVSYAALNDLQYVEAFIGGVCSIMTSLVLPVLFHYFLYRNDKKTSQLELIKDIVLTVVGVFVGGWIGFTSIKQLIERYG